MDARKINLEHGLDYTKRLRVNYPDVNGRADYVSFWFKKSHDLLKPNGRAGLVGTNSIRQNNTREASLDYIVQHGGTITEAISSQVWSGEAAIHVSIVNWIKGTSNAKKRLSVQEGDSIDSPWKNYELDYINTSLSTGFDVNGAKSLKANSQSPTCFEGQQPGHEGFRITLTEYRQILQEAPAERDVIYHYLNGIDLLTGKWESEPAFIIDFEDRDIFEALRFKKAFQILESKVLPDWKVNADAEKTKTGKSTGEHQNRLKTWWQLKRNRKTMLLSIEKSNRYIVCSRVTKRPIFEFVSKQIRPDSSLSVFPLPDDYSFGILQSGIHWEWFTAKCSTLTERFRYTSDTVFDTFPWPQSPTNRQIEKVAEAAVTLRQLRREIMTRHNWSLRELYRTLETPGSNPLRTAQESLDRAVREAYNMPANAEILEFLLTLNLTLAAQESNNHPIQPPGLPTSYPTPEKLVTEDCIRVDNDKNQVAR